ncbi:multidrug efflux SMR transporter [Helicobacter fennelliae]|uniref:Spermidine export protein MdtJ n=2 Tax=Helicobacter fennelliae TaxID=215 RepID=T1DWB8_9HELI|nr:multidrug efflux SMR transporter [Helicobacter fennelliae]GAD19292.1 spermidine export protein MdtJ [Helicobacter fennelliae MRY12-0050]SQB99070.1 putative small multidrug resistance protein [Helicobacter fennelliae]STP08347.1 putative small multidrug resistance protein [Helicobacter fennelliae]STQ84760.1 putative small multidrug resistance protein [Helicobacter fennelliae]
MRVAKNPLLWAWMCLIIAILTEVIGSSFLKVGYVHDFHIIIFSHRIDCSFFVTAIFICISYYFIGLAIKKISVSIAYAMWEVLGVICIVLVSIFYFDEKLSTMQMCGIALGICGIILINLGEEKSSKSS